MSKYGSKNTEKLLRAGDFYCALWLAIDRMQRRDPQDTTKTVEYATSKLIDPSETELGDLQDLRRWLAAPYAHGAKVYQTAMLIKATAFFDKWAQEFEAEKAETVAV